MGLAILAKSWVNKAVNSKIDDIKKDVEEAVVSKLKENYYIGTFPYFDEGDGTVFTFEKLSPHEEPIVLIDENYNNFEKGFSIEIINNKIIIRSKYNANSMKVLITNCKNIKHFAGGRKSFIDNLIEQIR